MRRVHVTIHQEGRFDLFVRADDGREGWIARERIDEARTVDIATMNRAAKKRAWFLQTDAGRREVAHKPFDAEYHRVKIETEKGANVIVNAEWRVRGQEANGSLSLSIFATEVVDGTAPGWRLRKEIRYAATRLRLNMNDPNIVVTIPGIDYEFNVRGEIPALMPPSWAFNEV